MTYSGGCEGYTNISDQGTLVLDANLESTIKQIECVHRYHLVVLDGIETLYCSLKE